MNRTQYELYLRTWAHLNPNAVADNDFETFECEPCDNLRDAIKQAKAISKKIPFKYYNGIDVQQVQVVAYVDDEEEFGTTYHILWKETYENGKGLGRY